jgi:pyrroloquinoline quinone (PQQ) biosynthesis protein C
VVATHIAVWQQLATGVGKTTKVVLPKVLLQQHKIAVAVQAVAQAQAVQAQAVVVQVELAQVQLVAQAVFLVVVT